MVASTVCTARRDMQSLISSVVKIQAKRYLATATGPGKAPAHKLWTTAKYLLAVPPVSVGVWIATSDHPKATATLATQFPLRLSRDIFTAGSIVLDYTYSLQGLTGSAREDAKRAAHLRAANRLQALCFANGGIYIKLGQVAAQLDHLLPAEYVSVLRASMLNKCPISSYSEVARTIREDLGADPEQLFAEFEHSPIASASLAQVHRAVGLDGCVYAVKVQHAGLVDTYAADVATISFLVRLVHTLFPDFDYGWLVDEVRDTLPQELDFSTEASNGRRCQHNLQSRLSSVRGRVSVPTTYEAFSSRRVLTMDYVEGVGVTDREAMQAMGIRTKEVSDLMARAFNEMIFIHGYVHCDPHAANMLVQCRAGKPHLVLLDHGLYKEISDKFREEYAGLWQALVLGDAEGIKRHSVSMNAGDAYPLFAAMLTSRPWEAVTQQSADHLYIPQSEEERRQLQRHAAQFSREITELLGRVPRTLLLLLKTNDCLRSVDLALGQPVNTFLITARECTRALGMKEWRERPGLRSWFRIKRDEVKVEWRLMLFKALTWVHSLRARLFGMNKPAIAAA